MKKAIWGGVIASVIIFMGTYGVGAINDFRALKLVEGMLSSTRFLCSSVITATSTVLALILTLLSFSSKREETLRAAHYDRVKQIALFACINFIAAVILLLFISLPLDESEGLQSLYEILYYAILAYTAVLGGMLISLMLMLYQSAKEIILLIHPEVDSSSYLVKSEQEENEKEEEVEQH